MVLENKVALISGAAWGIGRATAQLFAREGAKVVLADIHEGRGREAEQIIRKAGGDALFVKTDVTRMDQVRSLVETAVGHYGRLDILHSNAGAVRYGTTTTLSEEAWDFNLNVCLKSCWMLTSLKYMW